MNHHKISEYIDNLKFKKKAMGGVDVEQVYEAIRELSSMYNELLAEVYEENEQLKSQLEGTPGFYEGTVYQTEKEAVEDIEGIVGTEETSLESQVKELRKLKRKDLLEIMLEQSRKSEDQRVLIEVQKKKILHLESRLQERKIAIDEAGSLAEASLKLNGIFEAAQAAAQQYLDNLESTDMKCAAMEQTTQRRCEEMKAQAEEECRILEEKTRTKCELREKESEEKCQEIDRKTKETVDKHWDELSSKLETFYNAHKGLKELLSSSGEILR